MLGVCSLARLRSVDNYDHPLWASLLKPAASHLGLEQGLPLKLTLHSPLILKMNQLEQLFETYRGHDQTLSLIGYTSKMVSGFYGEETPKRAAWATLSSQISSARVVLRLLDDVAMLNATLAYGLGKHVRPRLGHLGLKSRNRFDL